MRKISHIAAPSVNPMANPLTAFWPPWRLGGGSIKSASDANLEARSGHAILAEWCFAGLVISAVIGEFIIAAVHSPYDSWLERWGSAYADLLIAIGIALEVLAGLVAHTCQNELTRRSNIKLGEANQKAAEAIERAAEIERITGFRRISHDQYEKVRTSIWGLQAKLDLLIEFQRGDTEAYVYARDISTMFLGIATVRMIPNTYLEDVLFGLFVATSNASDMEVIASAFMDAGIGFARMERDLSKHLPRHVPAPSVYIFVAIKPPPPLMSPAIPPKPPEQANLTTDKAK